MEPDLVRGAATRKSIPEPVWPRAGKVADQVKVFNERSSPPRNTIIEIKNDSQSATSAATTTTTSSRASVIPIKPPPPLPPTFPSPLPPFASTTTSHRFNVFDTSNDSTGASSNRSKSFPAPKRYPEMRRFPGHFQPNRDMSPIGECPSHDETEEERKTFGGHNDSIVTEALLRMTGKGRVPWSSGYG